MNIQVWKLLAYLFFPEFMKCVLCSQGSCHLEPSVAGSGHVVCEGNFEEINDLATSVDQIKDPLSVFELRRVTLDAMPPNLFRNISNAAIETVLFDEVEVKVISVPELGDSPFEAVKHSLERIEIYNSKYIFSWYWKLLPVMKNLKALIIENSKLISVYRQFSFAPNLRLLQLIRSEVKYLHPYSFRELQNLTFLSLADNSIKDLQRSLFPDVARKLWSLDFSNNKLVSLPEDLFTNMPILSEIKLDGNSLHAISALKTVWEQVKQLWLQGNPFQCTDLCWTRQVKNSPLFFNSTRCTQESNKNVYITQERCKAITTF